MMTIEQVFENLPTRFKAEKAKDYQGVFHFILSDKDSVKEYTVHLEKGICEVKKGLEKEANCIIESSVETYLGVELGQIKPQMVMASGELKISNLMEMMTFSQFFKKLETKEEKTQSQNSRRPQHGPLQGLKVLDFTRLLPGPLGTMMMADMGAEVIKVESPKFKDYTRDFPPFLGGESAGYLAFNRSKRSLAIDYATEEGKALIYELVKKVDIVIEQFRPNVMAKMGLGYEDLKAINPKIIYVSITGYGQTGPYSQFAGHDLNYIAYAGVLAGNQNEAPQMPNVQMADIAGGSYMSIIACLSAVYARNTTGKGQFIDLAMLDAVMPLTANSQALYWATKQNTPREKGFLSGGLINYNIYACKDKKYIALGTLEPKFWNRFCEIVDKPDWKARMLEQNPEKLAMYKKELEALFQAENQTHWIDLGVKYDLLINAIYELNEVEKDEHIKAREMIIEQEHPTAGKIKNIGIPLKFSETKAQPAWTPPLFGEDSKAILEELGIETEKVKDLIEKGIVKS